jgi:SH3 domain protein
MQSLIKTCVLVLLSAILLTANAAAERRYVSEEFEITMRTGPGSDRKIISLIPSGQEVDVVNAGEEWSEVVLANGKQGWVLSRYLTEQLPTALKLERLQQRYDKILAENKELSAQATKLGTDNSRLTNELDQTQTDLNQLTSAHETLKSESAEFLKLKSKYETAVKEMKEASTKAEKAESALNQLAGNEFNKGLLYGGGLLIFGFIVGYILKRPKRRAPLM